MIMIGHYDELPDKCKNSTLGIFWKLMDNKEMLTFFLSHVCTYDLMICAKDAQVTRTVYIQQGT